MRLIKKIIGLIQPYIVTVFSILLFVSFAVVMALFYFSLNKYIASGATEALKEARSLIEETETDEAGFLLRVISGNHRFSPMDVKVFTVDKHFEPIEILLPPSAVIISEALVEHKAHFVLTEGLKIRSFNDIFYISIVPVEDYAIIYYLDVSEVQAFAAVAIILLFISLTLVCLFAMILAGGFAEFTMSQLRVLRDFVRQIGRGDFTPNTHTFPNEDFNELNQSLNSTAGQLAKYDNEQKAFFQNVSHELRTPLMSIKSYAEAIQHGIMEPVFASATILEATNRLAGMVDDILYVSRLDNVAAPPMEKINLCVIVEERIRQQQPVAESRGLIIKYISGDEPINVKCSVKYIERAIDNLISNAIRYAETTIKIECYAINKNAYIRVTDDGPGFLPNEIPHLFERFYKGRNGLSGIGLSTVKAITDQHKGSATAENGNEKGAVLTISIPRKKPKG